MSTTRLSVPSTISAIVAEIAARFHPARIVLFGSHAYGRPTEESDVDLMVVMDTDLPPSEQAAMIRREIEPALDASLDLHVRTPAQIRLGLREHDFFIRDAMLKGITLYEGRDVGTEDEAMGEAEAPGGLKHATREWLATAQKDADVAVRLLGEPDPYTNLICFLAQQSTEKTLKGFLQERKIVFPRTHKLDVLAGLAGSLILALAAHRATLKALTPCAVEARYPSLTVSLDQATAAVRTMTEVRALILAALGLPDTAA